MARWTGAWLSDPGNAALRNDTQRPRWPGEHFGLPETGVGSVAGGGRRVAALLIDLVLAALVTAVFVRVNFTDPAVMREFNLVSVGVWAALTSSSAALFSFTPGMAAIGIRVARLDGANMVGLWRAVVRCVFTFVIVPAAVRNADSRGLHDRVTGTIVMRMR